MGNITCTVTVDLVLNAMKAENLTTVTDFETKFYIYLSQEKRIQESSYRAVNRVAVVSTYLADAINLWSFVQCFMVGKQSVLFYFFEFWTDVPQPCIYNSWNQILSCGHSYSPEVIVSVLVYISQGFWVPLLERQRLCKPKICSQIASHAWACIHCLLMSKLQSQTFKKNFIFYEK